MFLVALIPSRSGAVFDDYQLQDKRALENTDAHDQAALLHCTLHPLSTCGHNDVVVVVVVVASTRVFALHPVELS